MEEAGEEGKGRGEKMRDLWSFVFGVLPAFHCLVDLSDVLLLLTHQALFLPPPSPLHGIESSCSHHFWTMEQDGMGWEDGMRWDLVKWNLMVVWKIRIGGLLCTRYASCSFLLLSSCSSYRTIPCSSPLLPSAPHFSKRIPSPHTEAVLFYLINCTYYSICRFLPVATASATATCTALVLSFWSL